MIDIDLNQDCEGEMALEESYFFNQLNAEELAYLHTITQTRSYPQGSILFYAGERPTVLHVLDAGIVQILKHDSNGNEIHLAFFHPSDMIAEMAHFESIPYPATARCESDIRVFEINFEAFKTYFLDNPKLSFAIIRSLTRKIKQLESIVHGSLIDDAQTRLARFIIEHEKTLSSFTQRKIAELLLLTPETVSRHIRRFKEEGWVEVKQKKLYPLNLDELRHFLSSRT
ncbi:Crp/Fnr family transcriptional regulator [Sulfuricurvum sp.]|nr:Crp/Fnr family transcriptional regulator [Sulfuricurvum sp.]MDD4948128.1 Crp/Fnr family transcriptional regulator [Sulfuricurvum sp.]